MADKYDEWIARSKDLFATCQQLADECRKIQREKDSAEEDKKYYYKRYMEYSDEMEKLKARLHNPTGGTKA